MMRATIPRRNFFAINDKGSTAAPLVKVGVDKVEVHLVGVHSGEEVTAAGGVFEIEELVFLEAMHGLYGRFTKCGLLRGGVRTKKERKLPGKTASRRCGASSGTNSPTSSGQKRSRCIRVDISASTPRLIQ